LDSNVTNQLLVLFVLMAVGFVAVKLKLLDKAGADKISSLISRVTMPSMYIATFMTQQVTAEGLKNAGILLGFSAVYYLLAVGISFLFVKLVPTDPKGRGIYQFLIVFSNAAYMGFPVLRAVLGEEAIFYGAFFNIPFNILAYSMGIWFLRRSQPGKTLSKKEMLFNPGTTGIMIGVLLFLLSPLVEGTVIHKIFYQGPVLEGLKQIGSTTISLSMVVIGTVLATAKVGEVFKNLRAFLVSATRLLVVPALMLLVVLPFRGLVNPLILSIPILIAGMPCAVFSVILAKEYDGDEKLASVGVFLSTLFSAVTIPLFAYLINTLVQ
jgi:predicted permease